MSKKPATVFAAGCFNRVHKAHLAMLHAARSLGDRLVLVLSHDSHNHKPNAVPAKKRLTWLKSLKVADKVLVGEPDSFAKSLRREKPDILVLGYDQRLPDAETRAAVRELGIEIVQLPWYPGKDETVLGTSASGRGGSACA